MRLMVIHVFFCTLALMGMTGPLWAAEEPGDLKETGKKEISPAPGKKEPVSEGRTPESQQKTAESKLLSDEGLLYVKSGKMDLTIKGFFHFGWVATEDDSVYGDTADGFAVQRGRLILSANVNPLINFFCVFAPWGPPSTLLDAKITARFGKDFDALRLVCGQYKIPFTHAGLTYCVPIPKQLCIRHPRIFQGGAIRISDREIGVHAEGDLFGKRIGYALGIYTGEGKNTVPNDSRYDTMGRLLFSPFNGAKFLGGALSGLTFGGAYMWGHKPASSAPAFFRGIRERYCATILWGWKGFLLQTEVIRQNYMRSGLECQKTWDFYVQAAYTVNLYKKGAVDLKLQPLCRFERYDPNVDRRNTEDRWTFGFNFFLSNHALISFNYGYYKGNFTDDREDNEVIIQLQVMY